MRRLRRAAGLADIRTQKPAATAPEALQFYAFEPNHSDRMGATMSDLRPPITGILAMGQANLAAASRQRLPERGAIPGEQRSSIGDVVTSATTNPRARVTPVTVIVPTFNRCGWLPQAIASVLAQTYGDFHLIVSDNASTDETPDVVARFDDPRLTYVRRDRNVGLNEHYNLCVDEVETEYFLIVPDDDALVPHAIETLLPVLQQNPNAGIAHGRARLEQGDLVVSSSHDMTGLVEDTVEAGATFIRRAMRSSHRVHATTVLYRAEAIKPVPLDPRDYPSTEFGVWLRLALDWDIAFVAKTVAIYRMHTSSYTSGNASVTGGGYIQGPDTIQNIYDVKMRFLEEHGRRLADVRRLRRDARRALRLQLVNYAGHVTLPQRRLVETIRTLGDCARREPRLILEPGAWRLLAGSVLGPGLVERIKRRRQDRTTMKEATSR